MRTLTYDEQFAAQLIAYLRSEAALSNEERTDDDDAMAAADALYATMASCRLPETSDPEALEKFFTTEMLGRVLACPKINVDLLDDWGILGTEPGFLFLCSMNYEGARSLNDRLWLQGRTVRTVSGLSVPVIGSYDSVPRIKFSFDIATPSNRAAVYRFLLNKVAMPALPIHEV